jgi:hypothetical protein
MPIVTIQVTREGTKPGTNSVTAGEKAALIKGASELLLNVLNARCDFRHHRGSRHRQLGLGRPARARISAPARSGGTVISAATDGRTPWRN